MFKYLRLPIEQEINETFWTYIIIWQNKLVMTSRKSDEYKLWNKNKKLQKYSLEWMNFTRSEDLYHELRGHRTELEAI